MVMPGLPQWDHLGMTRGLRWTPEQKAAYEQGKQLATPERMDAKQAQDADSPSGQFARQLDAAGIKYELEYEKLNEAALLGWRVLLVTPEDVTSGRALELVRRALG